MKKLVINPADIDQSLVKEAARIISRGGIAAIPTETVYGLAGNEAGREKLYNLKGRAKDKPFTFAVADNDTVIDSYFSPLPPFAHRMINRWWPGPLTIIYYSTKDEKIGVRVPLHPVARSILREVNAPVYLPSANLSGGQETHSAAEVEAVFDGDIDLIVDGGSVSYGKASTIVDLTRSPFLVVRHGAVSERDLVDSFIRKRIVFVCTGNTCRSPIAEYLLKKFITGEKSFAEDRYEIISRGLGAQEGAVMSSESASILKQEDNINAHDFVSHKLDRQTILSSDLIFTMDDAQAEYILKMESTADGRVFSLKKFLPSESEQDIPDPIGNSYEYYETVYNLIRQAVLELLNWL